MVGAFPFPSPQGSQVFVRQMCQELAARGHEVHLVTYGQGHRVIGEGYEHHRLGRLPGDDAARSGPSMVKPLLDLMLAKSLISLSKTYDFDLVHAHNYEATVAALLARSLTGTPVLHHSHTLFAEELPTYFDASFSRAVAGGLGRVTDRFVPGRCDRIIALCEPSAAILRKGRGAVQGVDVVPPAVRDEGELPATAEARAALGLPEDGFIVGYSGNLDSYQALEVFLAAARSFGPDQRVCFLVATHDARGPVARRLAEEGPALRVLEVAGWAEARRAIQACDVMVLPRETGAGFPIKLLNYMSGGRPVVTAGCGAKLIRHGVEGLVVADGSVPALVDALRGLAEDPTSADTLAHNARKTYVARLTWNQVIPSIEASYARLLDPR